MKRWTGPGPGAALAAGLLLFFFGPIQPAALSAQRVPPAAPSAAPQRMTAPRMPVASRSVPDSVVLVARVKDAQRRFENLRRDDLPLRLGGFSSRCDETVGRMCWRHDYDPHWTPEPESERVWNGRLTLLRVLEEVHPSIPGDPWVLGLRVRYLTEARFTNLAQRVAREECLAARSWCLALEGYSLHRSGWTEEAQEVFEAALGLMTPSEVEDWLDLRKIMGGSRYDWALEGEDRAARVRTFWALSDPLALTPGNERWVEHMARATEARMSRDARNPHNLPWGEDLEELLIRYGPEVGWETIPAPMGSNLPDGVVGHEDPLGRQFTPPEDVLERPFQTEPEDWVPEVERPREAYAPADALFLVELDYQISYFRRGDSLQVLAAWSWPSGAEAEARSFDHGWRPPLAQSPLARRGLFALAEGRTEWEGGWTVGPEGSATLLIPGTSHVLSLEAVDPEWGLAGRVRLGIDPTPLPPGVAGLSSLILLNPQGDRPTTLDAAALALAPNRTVRAGGTLRIAWEIYGLRPEGDGPAYRLSIRPAGESMFRRAGRWLRILGEPDQTTVEWVDLPPPVMGPMLRTMDVELPDLEAGRYEVRLEAVLPGRTPLQESLEIVLVDASGPPP